MLSYVTNLRVNKRVTGPKSDVLKGQRLPFVIVVYVCYVLLQRELGC